jgi:hypothetical protein
VNALHPPPHKNLSKEKQTPLCDAFSAYLLVTTNSWVLNDALQLHICDELEMMWKEAVMTHVKVLSQHLLG